MDTRPADDKAITRVLGPEGLLSQRLPGYEGRPAQLEMARRVMACLREGNRLVVEAGTGTGKTLAYLVPALLSGLKVVISTGTRTLQEQIASRDLPLLRELLDPELRFACMKGIGNYLCRRRFAQLRRTRELFGADPLSAELEAWAARTRTGDRAELPSLPDDAPLWAEVSPTPESRLGSRCAFYEDCFVTVMRRAAAGARLLVVNHHLLLADLAVRESYPEASVIPPYEALILDEAHALEEIATSFFGSTLSAEKCAALARDVERSARLDDDEAGARMARHFLESSAELFHRLAAALPALSQSEGPSGDGARLRLTAEPLGGNLQQAYFVVDAALEALAAHLPRGGREDLVCLGRRAESLRETLALFAEPARPGRIFWVEHRRRDRLALHASPVDVGPLLASTLLADELPIVFTSATLAVSIPSRGEELDEPSRGASSPCAYFRRRVGLHEAGVGPVEELVLPSPYDFTRQALLYTPRDLPDPNQPAFILRASERISQLIDITAGRALVLFTSYRNMQAAWALLNAPGQLPSYPLLCQGSAPRHLLLARFREEVSSVLLATASFWQGIDVVGESLSMVIIDRLPFAVPDDPLTAARMQQLSEEGRSPFMDYQLPQALLALKQGFGRLIRHREDHGVVAILDPRLHERPYGRTLLAQLPPAPRTTDLLRVRAFCKELGLGRSPS